MRSPHAPTATAAGHVRASLYAPLSARENGTAEAERWLQAVCGAGELPPLLIVIGLGDGRLLEAIERRSAATKLLVLEPDHSAATEFLATRVAAAWRKTGRMHYLQAPAYKGADEAWRLFPPDGAGFTLLTHPRLRDAGHTAVAARTVKEIVFGVRANAEARRRFAPRYLRNVIANVPAMIAGRDVRDLAGVYTGTPALITAAGPSLDHTLDELPRLASRAVLIAADTTMRPLLGMGISPHFVVGADPGSANARHFVDVPECPETWLVAESALDAAASRPFDDRTFWFRLANHHPWPWLQTCGVDVGHLEMWGSVLTAAFQVACLAGCDPIVIAGADLSFTDGRPYCRGTTYEFDWAYHAAAGTSLADTWRTQTARRNATMARDLRGVETPTTAAMLSFRDWMLARIRSSGRRVINATGAGMLYGEGITAMPLATALAASSSIPPVSALIAKRRHAVSAAALFDSLRQARAALSTGTGDVEPIRAWRSFSGDGFDAEALRRVLDAAADSLLKDPRETASPSSSRVQTHSVRGLAESTARLVSALRGDAPSPASTDPEGDLVRALALLPGIGEQADALGLMTELPPNANDAPVTLSYEWPEPLRWDVQRFEALLGDACRRGIARTSGPADPPIDDGPPTRTAPVAAAHAVLRLTREWVECLGTYDGVRAEAQSFIDILQRSERAVLRTGPARTVTTFHLEARADQVSACFAVRVPVESVAPSPVPGHGAQPDGDSPRLVLIDTPRLRVLATPCAFLEVSGVSAGGTPA